MLTPEQAQRFAAELRQAAAQAAESPSPFHREGLGDGESGDSTEIPQRIGRYRIIRPIARGGMGTVYEAQQEKPHRTVAIKVLSPALLPPDRLQAALKRFEYEAEILGALQHSGIGQVFEAGSFDDGRAAVPFIVMEFIPNAQSITAHADSQQLDVRQRLELFAQVCDAVHFAHQKGVIHRDLKPANILVQCAPALRAGSPDSENRGTVKIIDFGIARVTNSDVTLTLDKGDVRELLGTLQYMSPEQCSGDSKNLDVRSDVYSLGVILYELLCGQTPYEISSDTPIPHATRMIVENDPPRPSSVHRALRGDLEAIVLKALEKDRIRRYQSAGDFAADVRRYLKGEPVDARRPSGWMRAVKWVGRHPVIGTIATCTCIVASTALLTVFSVWWFDVQPVRFSDISKDLHTCYLLSRSGVNLQTIGGSTESVVSFAVVASRPLEFGGGKFALFSAKGSAGENLTGGQLFITPVTSLEDVVWQTDAGPEFIHVPPPLQTGSERFVVSLMVCADIFKNDDHPGDEIVVVHESSDGSPCCIRVYDWNHNVLFETWHYGLINSMCWMENWGLLVCGGDRHGIDYQSANNWVREKEPDMPARVLGHGDYPAAVFAVKPALGAPVQWINDANDAGSNSTEKWSRCLYPLSLPREFRLRVQTKDASDSEVVLVQIHKLHSNVGLTIEVDQDGAEAGRNANDAFDAAVKDGEIPLQSMFGLGLTPPITKTMDEVASAAAHSN